MSMLELRRYLYNSINNKIIGWFIILLATAGKSILTGVYSSYETDKSFYLLLANNLSEGKGFTIPISFLNNPGVTENIYIPSASSPLYSILAAPLIKLFPGNYFLITWIIESCSWLLLFIIVYKILRRLMPDYFWPNMFILFAGFFLYNIELSSSTKDVLSTALLLAGLLQCLYLGSAKKFSWPVLFFSSLLFLLPGLTKSIYSPVTIVFPFSILFIGIVGNDRIRIKTGLVCLFFSLLLWAGHYFYFHKLETEAFAQYRDFFLQRWSMAKTGDDFVSGFYFENLLRLYPFIPASLFNLDSTGAQIRDHLPTMYRAYGFLLYLSNAIGIAALIAIFFSVCKRHFRKTIPANISFLISGLIISFSILLITCVLSLRYQAIEYKGSTGSWTFVYENRPYFFSILFLQVCLFLFLFSRPLISITWIRIKWLLVLILTIGAVHGFYFTVKNTIKPTRMKITINQLISAKADSIQQANPGQPVWLATEMPHLEWYAKLQKIHVVNRLPLLKDSTFNIPAHTIMLTAIAKEDSSFISNYLRRPDVRLLENYDGAYLLFIQQAKN